MELDDKSKLERTELVREKCGVSYAEAKAALELCGYDVLDAVVLLENQGKTASATASYSTAQASEAGSSETMARAQADYEESARKSRAEEWAARFFAGVRSLCDRILPVTLVVSRKGKEVASLPLIFVIAIALLAWWTLLPFVIISFFVGFTYRFEGLGKVTVDVNDLSAKASEGAERIKREVKDMADESPRDGHIN